MGLVLGVYAAGTPPPGRQAWMSPYFDVLNQLLANTALWLKVASGFGHSQEHQGRRCSLLGEGPRLVRSYQPFLALRLREKPGMEVKHLRMEVMVQAAANYQGVSPTVSALEASEFRVEVKLVSLTSRSFLTVSSPVRPMQYQRLAEQAASRWRLPAFCPNQSN